MTCWIQQEEPDRCKSWLKPQNIQTSEIYFTAVFLWISGNQQPGMIHTAVSPPDEEAQTERLRQALSFFFIELNLYIWLHTLFMASLSDAALNCINMFGWGYGPAAGQTNTRPLKHNRQSEERISPYQDQLRKNKHLIYSLLELRMWWLLKGAVLVKLSDICIICTTNKSYFLHRCSPRAKICK